MPKEQAVLIESMTKVLVFGWKIRVWRQEAAFSSNYPETQRLVKETVEKWRKSQNNIDALADALFDLDRVLAFEILDTSDNGVVVYKEW